MTLTLKVMKYELYDILRNRWIVLYTLFFLVFTDLLFRFGGGGGKVILSFLNIMLFLIPLVSLLFGVMYLSHSREFVELLLSQPVNRRNLYRGMYWGLAAPLGLGFLTGVSLPYSFHDGAAEPVLLALVLVSGMLLTFVFVALAFYIAMRFEDRTTAFGVAIVVWLCFAVIYDAAILLAGFSFADYPLEKALLALSFFNPIDMARIFVLLQTDFAALMGYTGAVFRDFFQQQWGMTLTALAMAIWAVVPYRLGACAFRRKDF